MTKFFIAVAVVACVIATAVAGPGKGKPKDKADREDTVEKGFWKILVKPKASWTLQETLVEKSGTITVETYDVRKIEDADVARIRWTLKRGKETENIGGTEGRYTQVAVNSKGLYILEDKMDDAAVKKALAGKPSRSDPPKPYKGTKLNEGRYLIIMNGLVCIGEGPRPGDGECPDTCDGTMCISPTDGVVKMMGTWAPGTSIFAQKGYDDL